jgi:p-aminobenzoyl-glutamate transporter AbgT
MVNPWAILAAIVLVFVLVTASRHLLRDLKWLMEAPSYTQVVRSIVTLTFVGAYAFGFLLIVREVTTDADSLDNVEGYGLVLALVGNYVERIIDKLYSTD